MRRYLQRFPEAIHTQLLKQELFHDLLPVLHRNTIFVAVVLQHGHARIVIDAVALQHVLQPRDVLLHNPFVQWCFLDGQRVGDADVPHHLVGKVKQLRVV